MLISVGFVGFFFSQNTNNGIAKDENAVEWNGEQSLPKPTIGNSPAIETPGFKEIVFIVNQITANVNGDGRIEFQHENGINTLTKDIIENSNPSYPVDPDILPNHCVGYFAGDDVTSKIQFGLSDQSFDCDYPKAGNYSATVNFQVFLVENE
nr:MAG TPA: hypothetical protein [Caudoviricetes sp.]